MSEKNVGAKTLLLSIIMSSPGPLVLGLGLLIGRSSTQIADFMRRSAEFLAILTSFVVYKAISDDSAHTEEKKQSLERCSKIFIGSLMCVAGLTMAVLSLSLKNTDKGNVLPSLAIAVLSAAANSFFWIKYTRLNKSMPNSILAMQSKLYRAKTLVDISVAAASAAVVINSASPVSYWMDTIGSLVVATYLLWSGAGTVYQEFTNS